MPESGLTSAAELRKRFVSATPPMPSANRPKKSRRFISKLICVFGESLISSFHDGFIEVQERICDEGSGGEFDGRNCGIVGFVADDEELRGLLLVASEDLTLFLVHFR